jgi:hypothetical protein
VHHGPVPRIHWAVRCRARANSTGLRCQEWAIRGGFTCWYHGGAAPQVRRKAAERLELLKAEQKLVRKLGRPLTGIEFALLSGNMPAYHREVRSYLAQRRTDAQDALARLRNTLET